jgi:hypothetical protein
MPSPSRFTTVNYRSGVSSEIPMSITYKSQQVRRVKVFYREAGAPEAPAAIPPLMDVDCVPQIQRFGHGATDEEKQDTKNPEERKREQT